LTTGLSYTYSHNLDNVSEVFTFAGSGSVAVAQNPFDLNLGERGNSNIDLKHSVAWSFIWDIPALKSQQGVVGRLLGGWSVSGIYRWTTGRPMTPVCFSCSFGGGDNPITDRGFNATFVGYFSTTRPFLSNPNAPRGSVGFFSPPTSTTVPTLAHLFDLNTGAPTTPNAVQFIINNRAAATFFGNAIGVGRNTFRGPNFSRGDFAVFKNTKISERFGVQVRWEVRNIFNTPFLGIPDIFIDDGTPPFFDSAQSAGGVLPRIMTFGVRFTF